MQEQLVDISQVIQENQKGICFTVLPIVLRIVEIGNARFIENGEISGC